jgi:uncharacterized protein YkwD
MCVFLDCPKTERKAEMMKVRRMLLLCACPILFLAVASEAPLIERQSIQELYAAATRQRAQHSLPSQELDESLCEVAQRWAENMASRNMMYHGGGEQIIAYGYPSADACVQGWIYSPGHRVWVLGNHERCGFGSARSASGVVYYAGVYR